LPFRRTPHLTFTGLGKNKWDIHLFRLQDEAQRFTFVSMPRTARASVGGICYHVLNRGNGRQQVFFKDGDYAAFLKALTHACEQIPMRVLAYCLMPNHFHLVRWPREDGDLSAWMHWLANAHVRRYHQHYKGSGHLWQGRFKAFPIEQDEHLLTVIRYVERNPLRAALVESVEQWAGRACLPVSIWVLVRRGCRTGR
jgi:putative transposase